MTTDIAESTIAAQRQRLTEAADEITALRDRVAALEGALGLWMETDIVSDDGVYRGAHWIGMLRGGDVAQAAEATVAILSRAQQGGGDVRG